MNTVQWLDHAKSVLSIDSDYKLSKMLGISTTRLSNYRVGRNQMDEQICLSLEKLLKLTPGTILFDIQGERTKCQEAATVFHNLAKRLAAGVLALMLGFSTLFYTPPASADNLSNSTFYTL